MQYIFFDTALRSQNIGPLVNFSSAKLHLAHISFHSFGCVSWLSWPTYVVILDAEKCATFPPQQGWLCGHACIPACSVMAWFCVFSKKETYSNMFLLCFAVSMCWLQCSAATPAPTYCFLHVEAWKPLCNHVSNRAGEQRKKKKLSRLSSWKNAYCQKRWNVCICENSQWEDFKILGEVLVQSSWLPGGPSWMKHLWRQMHQAAFPWFVIRVVAECFACGLKWGDEQWSGSAFFSTQCLCFQGGKQEIPSPTPQLVATVMSHAAKAWASMAHTHVSSWVWRDQNVYFFKKCK